MQGEIYRSGIPEEGGGAPPRQGHKPQPPRLVELPEGCVAVSAAVGPGRSCVVCSNGSVLLLGKPLLEKEKKEKKEKKKKKKKGDGLFGGLEPEEPEEEEEAKGGKGKGAGFREPPGFGRGGPFGRGRMAADLIRGGRGYGKGKGGPKGGKGDWREEEDDSDGKKKEAEKSAWVVVEGLAGCGVIAASLGERHGAFLTHDGALYAVGDSSLGHAAYQTRWRMLILTHERAGQCGTPTPQKHAGLQRVPGTKQVI